MEQDDIFTILAIARKEIFEVCWEGYKWPTIQAIREKYKARLLEYIAKEGHINQQDKDGDTLLHYAVDLGDDDMVKILIDHGADITIKAQRFTIKNGNTQENASPWDVAISWTGIIDREGLMDPYQHVKSRPILTIFINSKRCMLKLILKEGFRKIWEDSFEVKRAFDDAILKNLAQKCAALYLTYTQARTFIIGRIPNQGSLIAMLSPDIIEHIFYFVGAENQRWALHPLLEQEIIKKAAQAELPKPRATNPYCLMQ